MTDSVVLQSNDERFEQDVLQVDAPVLVDFWAPWCGPCKAIGPIIDQVAQERSSALRVVKLNVDSNTSVASQYGIRSIPTLLLFKAGVVVATKLGAVTKTDLLAFVDEHL